MNGVAGESIFYRPIIPFVDGEVAPDMQREIDALLPHLGADRDDRLLAVLASLLVENALDGILQRFSPKVIEGDT